MVLAVPLVLLTLISAFFCWFAVMIRPSGSWDDEAYAAIELGCVFSIGASGLAVALWSLRSVRQVMGWGWLVLPLVLALVSAVRWRTGV
ncbi:hypothetical protein HUT18_24550 [Streptomyces sp. NA04227]|uniref:hypothetical protein n=1 Tax=Streptomyces sp. NA04227 TaxID=2742136 RepID=UPI001591F0F7|nr:hypothetical protein [Streptomyces sp. NA04227]QKW09080.1 hypothetical protein HUT18_24550 [Streptomyces sp. NA04227]